MFPRVLTPEEVNIHVLDQETRTLTSVAVTTTDAEDVAVIMMALTKKYNYGFAQNSYTFKVRGDKTFTALVEDHMKKITAIEGRG